MVMACHPSVVALDLAARYSQQGLVSDCRAKFMRFPTHPRPLGLRIHRVAILPTAKTAPVTTGRELRSSQAARSDIDALLGRVGGGDQDAFADLYDAVAPRVYGLIRRVLRDPGLAEEVAQEALVEVWRTAARFDPSRGSAAGWIFTIAHRRAVDRVRAEQAAAERERRTATASVPFDEVVEEVTVRLEQTAVRRCLRSLTRLQREAILFAYFGGLTYRQVADRLDTALPTVKTRMRDGLIRLRDCLGVSWG
jgi:RNA polymerase sigma-70 factor (ECF subfamily)